MANHILRRTLEMLLRRTGNLENPIHVMHMFMYLSGDRCIFVGAG